MIEALLPVFGVGERPLGLGRQRCVLSFLRDVPIFDRLDYLPLPASPAADDVVPSGLADAAQDVKSVLGEARHVLPIAPRLVVPARGGSCSRLSE
jgi:hypothetical protein